MPSLRKGLNYPPHDGLFSNIWKGRQGYYSEGRNADIPVITEEDECTSISTRSEDTYSGLTRLSRLRTEYDTTMFFVCFYSAFYQKNNIMYTVHKIVILTLYCDSRIRASRTSIISCLSQSALSSVQLVN